MFHYLWQFIKFLSSFINLTILYNLFLSMSVFSLRTHANMHFFQQSLVVNISRTIDVRLSMHNLDAPLELLFPVNPWLLCVVHERPFSIEHFSSSTRIMRTCFKVIILQEVCCWQGNVLRRDDTFFFFKNSVLNYLNNSIVFKSLQKIRHTIKHWSHITLKMCVLFQGMWS